MSRRDPVRAAACQLARDGLRHDRGPGVAWARLILEAEALHYWCGWGLASVWAAIQRGDYETARATLDGVVVDLCELYERGQFAHCGPPPAGLCV